MRRSAALAIFAALLVAAPRPMYAGGSRGFHGGGFHGGFHGSHGGFHGFHGGFHGFHGGTRGFHGMRLSHHHMAHIGHHDAHGFAAAGHRFAHMNHLAGYHGRIDNAFASRHAWNHWAGSWHRHHIWFGGAFWPFLYGDLLSFVFWPYDYYDPFWDYDYDWLVAGIFWPGLLSTPLAVYDIYGDGHNHGRLIAGREQSSSESVAQACTGLAPGVAELPIGRIEKAISPIGDQVRLLEDLKEASLRAGTALRASCPNELPLTPVGRLDAMEQRFEAVGQLLKTVQTPLNTFYDSLSEEQRRRFDATVTSNNSREKAVLCEQRNAGISSLPEERIEQAVRPTEEQRNLLENLNVASSKAAQDLQSSCPTDVPQTILGRLGAIDARVGAMLKATKTVRPALYAFYASLDDEQKARFNSIGRPLDQAQGGRRSDIGSSVNLKSAEK